MKLSIQQLELLSEIAVEAATTAGAFIAESVSKQMVVNMKESGDNLSSQVVTEVDLKSQEIILEILNPTLEEFQLALITEENTDDKSRFAKDYFWCIDPMDGTLSFINKTPGFSVSIALLSKSGVPALGVIYDPLSKVIYRAIKGGGAFRNEIPMTIMNKMPNELPLTFVNDSSFYEAPIYKNVESYFNNICSLHQLNGMKTIGIGGAAMNSMWVIENAPACYFKFPKEEDGGGSIWDYAASACIYKEAGGWVSNMFGNELDLNRVETTFMNQYGILYATNSHLAQHIIALNKKIK